ncbi:hypothetical protein MASR2M29_03640 [Spirochaetota bacterium]
MAIELLHKDLTDKIINIFYEVYNELGYGFLEKVYKNAMCLELNKSGLDVSLEKKIKVLYKILKLANIMLILRKSTIVA